MTDPAPASRWTGTVITKAQISADMPTAEFEQFQQDLAAENWKPVCKLLTYYKRYILESIASDTPLHVIPEIVIMHASASDAALKTLWKYGKYKYVPKITHPGPKDITCSHMIWATYWRLTAMGVVAMRPKVETVGEDPWAEEAFGTGPT